MEKVLNRPGGRGISRQKRSIVNSGGLSNIYRETKDRGERSYNRSTPVLKVTHRDCGSGLGPYTKMRYL